MTACYFDLCEVCVSVRCVSCEVCVVAVDINGFLKLRKINVHSHYTIVISLIAKATRKTGRV